MMEDINMAAQKDIAKYRLTLDILKELWAKTYNIFRMTINEEGKIIEQGDYYDLWGNIFDDIPKFGKAYSR